MGPNGRNGQICSIAIRHPMLSETWYVFKVKYNILMTLFITILLKRYVTLSLSTPEVLFGLRY